MSAMQHYHLRAARTAARLRPAVLQMFGDAGMRSIVKSTLLGFGLVVGASVAAQAQSVASLPPNGGAVATPQSAVSQPYGSTQSFYPKPGGSEFFKEPHYQPPVDYSANKADHPYSTSIGPSPGSHSSGADVPYQPTASDNDPSRRPYSAGEGPKPN
jgi:hypothetical protein